MTGSSASFPPLALVLVRSFFQQDFPLRVLLLRHLLYGLSHEPCHETTVNCAQDSSCHELFSIGICHVQLIAGILRHLVDQHVLRPAVSLSERMQHVQIAIEIGSLFAKPLSIESL